jgi:hypothetical protein
MKKFFILARARTIIKDRVKFESTKFPVVEKNEREAVLIAEKKLKKDKFLFNSITISKA